MWKLTLCCVLTASCSQYNTDNILYKDVIVHHKEVKLRNFDGRKLYFWHAGIAFQVLINPCFLRSQPASKFFILYLKLDEGRVRTKKSLSVSRCASLLRSLFEDGIWFLTSLLLHTKDSLVYSCRSHRRGFQAICWPEDFNVKKNPVSQKLVFLELKYWMQLPNAHLSPSVCVPLASESFVFFNATASVLGQFLYPFRFLGYTHCDLVPG